MQVRNLDNAVQERLRRAAAQDGVSLSAFLRSKLTELARDLEVDERAATLDRGQRILGGSFPELAGISSEEIVRMVREDRDGR